MAPSHAPRKRRIDLDAWREIEPFPAHARYSDFGRCERVILNRMPSVPEFRCSLVGNSSAAVEEDDCAEGGARRPSRQRCDTTGPARPGGRRGPRGDPAATVADFSTAVLPSSRDGERPSSGGEDLALHYLPRLCRFVAEPSTRPGGWRSVRD
jgi:hypothetical protein